MSKELEVLINFYLGKFPQKDAALLRSFLKEIGNDIKGIKMSDAEVSIYSNEKIRKRFIKRINRKAVVEVLPKDYEYPYPVKSLSNN